MNKPALLVTLDPMVFSSPLFLFLFLPFTLASYFIVPARFPGIRNAILLLLSLLFYAWGEPANFWVMLLSIGVNHLAGIALEKYRPRQKLASWILYLSVTVNLALLGCYKYGDFAVANLNSLFSFFNLQQYPLPHLALPIGISFFTFHGLSYLIDVSRGTASCQRNIFNTALYITYFPQLIAGPIMRYADMAPALEKRSVTLHGFEYGIMRFCVGLAKKVLLANGVGEFADYAFQLSPDNLTTSIAWQGALAYTLQIYFDFSGYSDMAVGLGHMFGFRLMENFKYPYSAGSIRDFWRRWHISLSQWFRDYLYIPLGGNRRGAFRTYLNLWLVFVLCGFWHGASWAFIAWGAYHGFFLVLEHGRFGRLLDSLPRFLALPYTLLVVVHGWVLFRAETFSAALTYIYAMWGLAPGTATENAYYGLYWNNQTVFVVCIGLIASSPLPYRLFSAIFGGIPYEPSYTKDKQQQQKVVAPAKTQDEKSACANTASSASAALAFLGQSRKPLTLPGRLLLTIYLGFLLTACFANLASGLYNPFIYFRF